MQLLSNITHEQAVDLGKLRGVVPGGQEGQWPLQFFRNHRIFGNFNVFIGKSVSLAPLLYKCYDAPGEDTSKFPPFFPQTSKFTRAR